MKGCSLTYNAMLPSLESFALQIPNIKEESKEKICHYASYKAMQMAYDILREFCKPDVSEVDYPLGLMLSREGQMPYMVGLFQAIFSDSVHVSFTEKRSILTKIDFVPKENKRVNLTTVEVVGKFTRKQNPEDYKILTDVSLRFKPTPLPKPIQRLPTDKLEFENYMFSVCETTATFNAMIWAMYQADYNRVRDLSIADLIAMHEEVKPKDPYVTEYVQKTINFKLSYPFMDKAKTIEELVKLNTNHRSIFEQTLYHLFHQVVHSSFKENREETLKLLFSLADKVKDQKIFSSCIDAIKMNSNFKNILSNLASTTFNGTSIYIKIKELQKRTFDPILHRAMEKRLERTPAGELFKDGASLHLSLYSTLVPFNIAQYREVFINQEKEKVHKDVQAQKPEIEASIVQQWLADTLFVAKITELAKEEIKQKYAEKIWEEEERKLKQNEEAEGFALIG